MTNIGRLPPRVLLHRLHGNLLAEARVLRSNRVLSVRQQIPIPLDGLAEGGFDEGFEPGAGGEVAAVLAGEVVAVAGELVDFRRGGDQVVVVQPRSAGHLHGFAGGDDDRDVELPAGTIDTAFDGFIHLELVAVVAGEGAVVGVGGVGPGHVPDDRCTRIRRLLPDDGNELRDALLVGFPDAGIVRGLLDGDDVPGLVLEAVQDGRVPADGLPAVLGGLVVDVVRGTIGILLTVAFQGAAADVQAGDDDVADARGFEQAGEVFGAVVGEAVAHGEDPEGVRMLRQGIIVDADLGGQAQRHDERGQGQEEAFDSHNVQRYGFICYLCPRKIENEYEKACYAGPCGPGGGSRFRPG